MGRFVAESVVKVYNAQAPDVGKRVRHILTGLTGTVVARRDTLVQVTMDRPSILSNHLLHEHKFVVLNPGQHVKGRVACPHCHVLFESWSDGKCFFLPLGFSCRACMLKLVLKDKQDLPRPERKTQKKYAGKLTTPLEHRCEQENGFYKAIIENHEDPVNWLVYSDFLEEHQPGDTWQGRVKFIREMVGWTSDDVAYYSSDLIVERVSLLTPTGTSREWFVVTGFPSFRVESRMCSAILVRTSGRRVLSFSDATGGRDVALGANAVPLGLSRIIKKAMKNRS